MIQVKKFEGVELVSLDPDHPYLVRDTVLAEWLQFETPINIRGLIRRRTKELNSFGVIATVKETSGLAGGRPGTVFYLNELQAILTAVVSDAPRAAEVRRALILAFAASRVEKTESVIYNGLFLPAPVHTQLLWTPGRLGPIARLYGHQYVGGRPPLATRTIQRKIYDLLLGTKSVKELRVRYPDPPGTNGEPYIYDHFQPPVRAEFEVHLDRTVVPFAGRASGSDDFLATLRHEYLGRPLQLAFFTAPALKPARERLLKCRSAAPKKAKVETP